MPPSVGPLGGFHEQVTPCIAEDRGTALPCPFGRGGDVWWAVPNAVAPKASYEAIVVGSEFGGAVAACRLVQAGLAVPASRVGAEI